MAFEWLWKTLRRAWSERLLEARQSVCMEVAPRPRWCPRETGRHEREKDKLGISQDRWEVLCGTAEQ